MGPGINDHQMLPILAVALRQLSCFHVGVAMFSFPAQCHRWPQLPFYHIGFRYNVKDVAPFLLLPKLARFNLNMVVDDSEGYSLELKPRISSCKSLISN